MTKLLLLTTSLLFVYGCSTDQGGDASTNLEERILFHQMKYADPATGKIPDNIRTRELAFARHLPGAIDQRVKGEQVQQFSSFRQVGPHNVGGRTRALAMDVTDPNIILAGGISGGLWRSTDAGKSWTLQTAQDELHNVSCIWQDKREGKTNIWYYGTGEAYGNSAQITGDGLWKSTDNGITWSSIMSTSTGQSQATHAFAYTWRIASPLSDNLIVATAAAGLRRSTNEGQTWTSPFTTNSFFSDVVVTESGRFYAAFSTFTGRQGVVATRSGVFTSLDGETWEDITPEGFPSTIQRPVIGVVPGTDNMFVLANSPGEGKLGVFKLRSGDREEWHSLWKYTAGDGSWEDRSANIPAFGGRNGDLFSQGGYDLLVRVSPHDTNLVIVGGTNLYRSTDGFTSEENNAWIGGYGRPVEGLRFPRWENQHPDQHEVLFHPDEPLTIINGNDGGVYTTRDVYAPDSVVWETNNIGYYTTQFYALAIRDSANDENVLGGTQDNGTWEGVSAEVTDPFVKRNGGDGAYCAYADSGRTLYVSTQLGRTRRVLLDDAGNEIARGRVDPVGLTSSDYLFINPFVIDPNAEEKMYLAGGDMVWRNNDLTEIPLGTDDSTAVNWDSLPSTRTGGTVSALAMSVEPADILYFGTSTGKVFRMENASSEDATPVDVSEGLSGSGYLNNITIDKRDADHVIATFSSYNVLSIYESRDGGQSWRPISGNLEENRNGTGDGPAVNWTEIVPFDDNSDVLIAATSTGLYFTPETNGMSTVWTQIASDVIGNVPVDMLATRYSDKRVFVATHGRGIFTGTITDVPERPAATGLLSPRDGSRGIWPDTTVTWRPVVGAVSYSVELSTSEDFSENVQIYDGVEGIRVDISDLEPGPKTYYWRARAYAGGGASDYSDVWTFRTIVAAPDNPTPENGATDVPGLPVEISWDRREAATSYDYEVGENISFNPVIAGGTGIADTFALVDGLESGKRYFWHVRSRDADTFGLWTQRSRFTTGVLVSVDEDEIKQRTAVTIAPNPAQTSATVQLPSTVCTETTISITSIDGKEVDRFVVSTQQFDVNVSSYPAGTYQLSAQCRNDRYTTSFTVQR